MTAFYGSAEELKTRFLDRLDRAADLGTPIPFFWRDDDAISDTPALRTLISLSNRYGIPLALAVIPRDFDDTLCSLLKNEQLITVLQHGWAHQNHEPKGALKAELGETPPLTETLERLIEGRRRLEEGFGGKFLPVLVPPWNRISADVLEARNQVALPGVSVYRRRKTKQNHTVNTQLDVIGWRMGRKFIGEKRAFRRLLVEAERRCQGHAEPIGLLTHHLVHDQETRDFLELLLKILSEHPGAEFPGHRTLFAIS